MTTDTDVAVALCVIRVETAVTRRIASPDEQEMQPRAVAVHHLRQPFPRLCNVVCKNGDRKGAKVSFDLRTLYD